MSLPKNIVSEPKVANFTITSLIKHNQLSD
jgi:hypothetical protein